ncbi:MAG: hypothetical protein LRY48_00495, partial [Bacteroides graminisolvens]|nr:hypothetical protein [Bacteroides graminisolvens]
MVGSSNLLTPTFAEQRKRSGNTSSSGSGFNSTFASQEVQGLDDVGALQRTQLQYGVNNQQ